MKRLLITLLLAVLSTSAMAEWLNLTPSGDRAHYINMATIRKQGNIVKIWEMLDYKSPQKGPDGAPFLSIKTLVAYDCVNVTIAFPDFTYFSGNMGGGKRISNSQYSGGWRDIDPDSMMIVVWRQLCNK